MAAPSILSKKTYDEMNRAMLKLKMYIEDCKRTSKAKLECPVISSNVEVVVEMGFQAGFASVGKRYRNPKASNAIDILDTEVSLKAGHSDPPREYLNPKTAPTYIHTMELWWTSTHARARVATIAACAVRGSVVHFSGHQATEAAIKLTSLATFAGEQGTSSIKKFEYGCTDDQIESERAGTCSLKIPDPVWMVALRALSMVNNSDVEYNLLEKNCELFCCWCELGARSGIVNFASPEKRAIGQSDPERFRGLSSLTTSVVQSLGFRDAHVAAASAAVNTATQSALKHSDSVTALASVFLRTPSTKKDGNISRYRAIVAKVFASVPADLPNSVDEAVNSDDISRSISVVDAIVIDISENPRLLQNTEYITSPMTPDEWRSALQSALSNIDRVASRT
ncbi:hypothetical protein FOZ62_010690 [Perkinsus olseni]|uniref:LRAT domain-containing protein n=1 Tax=Perkinsus olseni TaxID=32597 RepID=A0A7J6RHL6_PEROL|nr:hypothetical protein FOZ62_010690 [Perkinsus olseni]